MVIFAADIQKHTIMNINKYVQIGCYKNKNNCLRTTVIPQKHINNMEFYTRITIPKAPFTFS